MALASRQNAINIEGVDLFIVLISILKSDIRKIML
jgi:hypothetical protein